MDYVFIRCHVKREKKNYDIKILIEKQKIVVRLHRFNIRVDQIH